MIIAIRFKVKDSENLSEVRIACEDYKHLVTDNSLLLSFKSDKKKKDCDVKTKIKVVGEIKEVDVV